MTPRFSSSQRSLLVLLTLMPLLGVGVLAVYLIGETARPGTFTRLPPETIPEAIVVGNGPRALEMLADGVDVNARARIRPGMLGAAEYQVTPVEAALLAQRIEVVRLLLRNGADVSRSPLAACLARAGLPEALPLLGLPPAEPIAGGPDACFAGPGAPVS